MYDHNALMSKVKNLYSKVYGVDPKIPYYQWSKDQLRLESKKLEKKLKFRSVDMNPSIKDFSETPYQEWVPPIDIGYRNV